MIYFDHAATTQMSESALKIYMQVAQQFYANSDSLHLFGNQRSNIITQAKTNISELLHIPTEGLVFTNGGTQGNQLGIVSLLNTSEERCDVLVSPLEHSSVYQTLERLELQGKINVCTLPVNSEGKVSPEVLENAITHRTALIIIQAVNSVTGIVQDISDLKIIAKNNDVPFFMDAVQAISKIPLDFVDISGFSVSSHKFNGPKGCGLLFLSPNAIVTPQYKNVFQQNGILPGTVDVPAIASLAVALQDNYLKINENLKHFQELKFKLVTSIAQTIKVIKGDFPGICGLVLPNTQGQEVVTKLGQLGICLSTVSACSILDPRPDPSLRSVGLMDSEISRYIRVSFGFDNTLEEVEILVKKLNTLFA